MQLQSNLLRGNERLQVAASNPLRPITLRELDAVAVARVQFAMTKLVGALPRSTSQQGLDGAFGDETRHAVISFQKQCGLKPDGIVGPRTLAKLDAIAAAMPLGGVAGPYPMTQGSPVPKRASLLLASAVRAPSAAASFSTSTAPGVTFSRFENSGVGAFGRQLGPGELFTFFMNAVELHFSIDASVRKSHRNFRPTQWSGTEAVWLKQGVSPIGEAANNSWRLHKSSLGTGVDDPTPENQKTLASGEIVYFDSPGPNVASYGSLRPRVSRLYVVQNFTGWIVAARVGGMEEPMCPVAAWHSITDLACTNWYIDDPKAVPQWHRMPGGGSRSGLGWANTQILPSL